MFYVQPSDHFLLGGIAYEHFGVSLEKLQPEVRLQMPWELRVLKMDAGQSSMKDGIQL